MYTGQLASMGLSKGVEVFLVACELLMNAGVPFHAVLAGGPLSVQEKLQSLLSSNLASRVTFLGHVPHASIPSLLSLASVLVYPAPKSLHPYFLRDTSPLKLFEYMASGKPIVAADLPPLRDVIDESMVAFFAQGDALECARVLEDVLRNPAQASQRAALAKERVLRFTWTMRMQRIFSHLLF
jgi:glycosyltransferase involved in cell wall biosynthesis